MNRLLLFRIVCVMLQIISFIALYLEICKYNIRSMTAVYVWAGLAIAALLGNAVGACFALLREKTLKK